MQAFTFSSSPRLIQYQVEWSEPPDERAGLAHPTTTVSETYFQLSRSEGGDMMKTLLKAGVLATLVVAIATPAVMPNVVLAQADVRQEDRRADRQDRKSTRLNSSHVSESRMPSSA